MTTSLLGSVRTWHLSTMIDQVYEYFDLGERRLQVVTFLSVVCAGYTIE